MYNKVQQTAWLAPKESKQTNINRLFYLIIFAVLTYSAQYQTRHMPTCHIYKHCLATKKAKITSLNTKYGWIL